MADGPRIAVGTAKVALIDGDSLSGIIFTSLILRRSKYAASDWYRRFFSFRFFSPTFNSYLLDVTHGNWSPLVCPERWYDSSLVQGAGSENCRRIRWQRSD